MNLDLDDDALLALPQEAGVIPNGRDYGISCGPILKRINGPDGFNWAVCVVKRDAVFGAQERTELVRIKMGLAR
jgi:hypothetical protein